MAGVAVNNRLRDTAKQLMDHNRLIVLGNRVKGLLNDVAAECIHGKIQCVASNSFSNLDDLLWSTMLEATLDKEVAKAVNHQRVGLGHNGLDNIILLLSCPNLEFLLKKDGRLLVIVANNLIDNVFPVAVDGAVKKTAIVQRLSGWEKGLTLHSNCVLRS